MNTATTLQPMATGTPQGQDPAATSMPSLWTIHDIAVFYRRSTRFAERLVRSDNFPRPVRGDKRRWFAADVQKWAHTAGVEVDEGEVLVHDKQLNKAARIHRPGPTPNERHHVRRLPSPARPTSTSRKEVA